MAVNSLPLEPHQGKCGPCFRPFSTILDLFSHQYVLQGPILFRVRVINRLDFLRIFHTHYNQLGHIARLFNGVCFLSYDVHKWMILKTTYSYVTTDVRFDWAKNFRSKTVWEEVKVGWHTHRGGEWDNQDIDQTLRWAQVHKLITLSYK